MSYFEPYLPAAGEWLALAACGAVLLGFAAVGGLVTGRRRVDGTDLLAGWGVVATLPVALQWVVVPDLRLYAALAAAAAAAGLILQRHSLERSDSWRPAVLLAPVLIVACGVPLDEWDSFSHWGINAAWLWRFDALPSPALPVSPSSNPDYPYGYPLALYFASLLRGAYIENAGAIVNVLVLVGVAGAYARLAAGDDGRRWRRRPWYWSAWGVLAVIVLNPGFVRGTTLAAYADTAFGATVLLLCLALRRFLAGDDSTGGALRAVGATALALVSLKEGGLLMLGVVAVATAVAAARNPETRGRIVPALLALSPAALAGLAWQRYVAGWLPSSFSILPFEQWRIDLLPSLLASIGAEMADHGLYYAMLAAVVALGVRGWWLDRDDGDRYLVLSALVVLGHLGTVMLAYLGASFTAEEVAHAASFHRYATQIGMAALGALVLVLGRRSAARHRALRRPWLVVTICGIVMLAGAPLLHRERSPAEDFYLSAGSEIAAMLPPDAVVGLVGWRDEPYGYFLLRYALFRPGKPAGGPTLERIFRQPAPAARGAERLLARLSRRGDLTHLLVIEPARLHPGAGPDMLLLARRGSRWTSMGRWQLQ